MPPLKKIGLHIGGIVRTYARHPYMNSLINMLQSTSAENAAELSTVFVRPLHDLQQQMLHEARDAGEIGEVNSLFFYFSVIGACDHIFKSRRILPFAFGIESVDGQLTREYADYLVNQIMSSLKATCA
jgi:TetR/AcrR family transcriptional regulator